MANDQNKSDELDNYGVWVKKPPRDIQSETEESSDDFSVSESDLPDFSDLDAALSEMDTTSSTNAAEEDPFADFNFDTTSEEPVAEDDSDTALTADELSNITSMEMTEDTAPVYEDVDDDFSLSEINADDGEAFLPEATRKQPKYEYEGENPIMPDANDTQETDKTEETVSESDVTSDDITLPDVSADSVDDFDLDAFNFDDVTDTKEEEPVKEETPNAAEEITVDDMFEDVLPKDESKEVPAPETDAADGFTDVNLDDIEDATAEFMSDDSGASNSLDSHADGEISLDEFFSDDSSSSSSGSGTTDATAEFSDGELNLDDFLGESSGPAKAPAPAEIVDEKAMDIDVSFTDDAAEITKAAEEEEKKQEEEAKAKEEAKAETIKTETEDVNLDEFDADSMFEDLNPTVEAAAASSASNNSSSSQDEEIDLSEFGITDDDSNIGMTKSSENEVPQKKETVDYDMKVSVEDDDAKVSVADVVNDNIGQTIEETETVQEDTAKAETKPEETKESSQGISAEGAAILQQIVGELASLKDEIKNLKTDFENIKANGVPEAGTKEESSNGGFFGDEDGDDTIALSGSELDNILNNAEFSTVDASDNASPADESTIPTDSIDVVENEEPVIEETLVNEPEVGDAAVTTEEGNAPSEDIFGTEEVAVDDDLTMDFDDENLEAPEIDTTEVTPEDLTADAVQEFDIDEELPEEITIPKSDDILVESSGSNLMDSVINTDEPQADAVTEEEPQTVDESAIDEFLADDISIEDSLTEDKMDYLSEKTDDNVADINEIMSDNSTTPTAAEENVSIGLNDDIDAAFAEAEAEESDIFDDAIKAQEDSSTTLEDAVNSVEANTLQSLNLPVTENETAADMGITEEEVDVSSFTDEPVVEETVAETPVIEEPVVEETIASDPVIEEPVFDEPAAEIEEPVVEEAEEPVIEETSVSVPEPEKAKTESSSSKEIPSDLKSEIISVLSYMDQLLENLPDDKITEFAQSEHFATYKKLFDELGLS